MTDRQMGLKFRGIVVDMDKLGFSLMQVISRQQEGCDREEIEKEVARIENYGTGN